MSEKVNSQKKSEKIDDHTMLLVDILQKAFFLAPDSDLSPMEYLERYDGSIRATGRVLKFLGLAEPIERRVIGWKPTPRFMSLLAKLRVRPLKASKKLSGHTDLALVELLLLAAGIDPYASGNDSGFACGVLEQLGLVREDGGGDWIPTRRLATLIVEDRETLLAYFDKVRSGVCVPVIQKS